MLSMHLVFAAELHLTALSSCERQQVMRGRFRVIATGLRTFSAAALALGSTDAQSGLRHGRLKGPVAAHPTALVRPTSYCTSPPTLALQGIGSSRHWHIKALYRGTAQA